MSLCASVPRWPLLAALLLEVSLAGCGGSKGLVPVEGRVTFGGGDPPGAGYLYFVPREMSTDRKKDTAGSMPGTALFTAAGRFRAMTFIEGDGLRPGTYEVRVECAPAPIKPLDAETHHAPVRNLVPQAFQPPDLIVPHSSPRPVRYDIDVRYDPSTSWREAVSAGDGAGPPTTVSPAVLPTADPGSARRLDGQQAARRRPMSSPRPVADRPRPQHPRRTTGWAARTS